jgi:hypothetical protein
VSFDPTATLETKPTEGDEVSKQQTEKANKKKRSHHDDGNREGPQEEENDADIEEEEESSDEDDEEDEDERAMYEYEYEGLDVHSEKKRLKEIKKIEGWDSIYQWLPAEYHIEADGEVKVESYINNLEHVSHERLYDIIAKIFRLFLPLFEKVCEREGTSG